MAMARKLTTEQIRDPYSLYCPKCGKLIAQIPSFVSEDAGFHSFISQNFIVTGKCGFCMEQIEIPNRFLWQRGY